MVNTGSIAKLFIIIRKHHFKNFGIQWCGCVIIEVNRFVHYPMLIDSPVPPFRCRTISDTILRAISSAVLDPKSNPAGE